MRALFYWWTLALTACAAADPVLRQGIKDVELRPQLARVSLLPYAKAGNTQAIEAICVAYGRSIDGQVCAPEREQAFTWCQQAATAGRAEAQYHLGLFYKSGIGTAPDRNAALQWFKVAASQGHESAEDEARGLEGKPRRCRNFITGCRMF